MDNYRDNKVEENEIDLKKLVKTVLDGKKFIFIFTTLITSLSIVYLSFQTPIYEAKAIVKIGEYKTTVDSNNQSKIKKLDSASSLTAELRVLYIDLLKNNRSNPTKIKEISVLKKQKDFLLISAYSISNELAVQEINNVVNYIQEKHQKILDEVVESKQLQLKNLQKQIDYFNNIKLVEIEEKIKYNEKSVLKSLESKIKLNRHNIVGYEKQLKLTEKNLSQIKESHSTLAAINIMEKRNLEEKINWLKTEYIDLKSEKEDLLLNILPSLKREKNNIAKSELEMLLEEKKLLKTTMLSHNYKNSEIIGKVLTNDYPIKPHKLSVVLLSFFTAILISTFLILFRNVMKEENI